MEQSAPQLPWDFSLAGKVLRYDLHFHKILQPGTANAAGEDSSPQQTTTEEAGVSLKLFGDVPRPYVSYRNEIKIRIGSENCQALPGNRLLLTAVLPPRIASDAATFSPPPSPTTSVAYNRQHRSVGSVEILDICFATTSKTNHTTPTTSASASAPSTEENAPPPREILANASTLQRWSEAEDDGALFRVSGVLQSCEVPGIMRTDSAMLERSPHLQHALPLAGATSSIMAAPVGIEPHPAALLSTSSPTPSPTSNSRRRRSPSGAARAVETTATTSSPPENNRTADDSTTTGTITSASAQDLHVNGRVAARSMPIGTQRSALDEEVEEEMEENSSLDESTNNYVVDETHSPTSLDTATPQQLRQLFQVMQNGGAIFVNDAGTRSDSGSEETENQNDSSGSAFLELPAELPVDMQVRVCDIDSCPVCFEDFSESLEKCVTAECGHAYCRQCALNVCRMRPPRYQGRCAVCRKKFSLRNMFCIQGGGAGTSGTSIAGAESLALVRCFPGFGLGINENRSRSPRAAAAGHQNEVLISSGGSGPPPRSLRFTREDFEEEVFERAAAALELLQSLEEGVREQIDFSGEEAPAGAGPGAAIGTTRTLPPVQPPGTQRGQNNLPPLQVGSYLLPMVDETSVDVETPSRTRHRNNSQRPTPLRIEERSVVANISDRDHEQDDNTDTSTRPQLVPRAHRVAVGQPSSLQDDVTRELNRIYGVTGELHEGQDMIDPQLAEVRRLRAEMFQRSRRFQARVEEQEAWQQSRPDDAAMERAQAAMERLQRELANMRHLTAHDDHETSSS
ncbi:unnamed protein product [Amoebophrya sp. A120]|nr:unnamed protein product [Amoebophrya sp. A120]|eukprot:GSA120T00011037001.1